ncbi:hypothetical protein [[Eubacterium] cellulosolvens]
MSWPESLIKQCVEAPALFYSGVRKILTDITWETDELPDLTYEDLGYGPNKFKQLCRNYLDLDELERVRTLLDKRAGQSFTSVAMSLRGQQKSDARSMGHCMQTLIIIWAKDTEIVEVQYRATEVIKKFGADLVFLRYILDELDLAPSLFRFRFASAYLSGVFFPTLCMHWRPIDFFDYLWEHDERLFAGGTRFVLRSASEQHQHFPYSPENTQHQVAWRELDMPAIREYLEKKHKKYGKPLPAIHYNKHAYVPRGKRK